MIDKGVLDEYLARLSDRYTAAELADILDISVEEFLEAFESRVLNSKFLLEEVGMQESD